MLAVLVRVELSWKVDCFATVRSSKLRIRSKPLISDGGSHEAMTHKLRVSLFRRRAPHVGVRCQSVRRTGVTLDIIDCNILLGSSDAIEHIATNLSLLCRSCVLFKTPHSEAAAWMAPAPLKAAGLVISTETGYFHSMTLAQPK